jgi:acyl dehydratase
MRVFEDIRLNDRVEIGTHVFTADAIKSFAARFDPQPWHLDETAAVHSLAGRLCASGWHVACTWMRLMVDYRRREDDVRRARGERVATLGVSPGFRDLTWPNPVLVDDVVTYFHEIVDKRPSLSRPQWGIMTAHNTGLNQRGDLVLSFTSSAFVGRRGQ